MYHPCLLLTTTSFTPVHAILIVVIVLLLCCSAFFSASETAFNSMNTIRLRSMAENKVKGAGRALYIAEHSSKVLTTILVGNNIVNILATTLCAFILSQLIADATLMSILNTVVMTIIILIFGEILPKALAKANPEKFAVKLARPMYWLIKIMTPIVIGFYALQRLFTKRQEQESVTVTEDELESIIDTMEEEGVLEKCDADLIQGTMKIKEATAHDIMTHRVDVKFLNVEATLDDAEKMFAEHQYSRLPVFKDSTDNIVGVISYKDVFSAKYNGKTPTVAELMFEPLFTAENTNIDTLIRDMQKEKKHLAIVIDENDGVSGIVTMEDCLETIVGEIYDETDVEEKAPEFKKITENEYEIDAEISVEDVFEKLKIENLPENPYQTVNSFLFELSEDIPEIDKKYEYDTTDDLLDDEGNMISKPIKMVFTIKQLDGHRITKVNLKIHYIESEEE